MAGKNGNRNETITPYQQAIFPTEYFIALKR